MAKATAEEKPVTPDPGVAAKDAAKAELAAEAEQKRVIAEEADKAAKLKAETEVKDKPKTALDSVLKPKSETDKTDDVPADAPAKQLRAAYERQKSEAARWKSEAEKRSTPDPEAAAKTEAAQKEHEALKAENAKLRDAITAIDFTYDPSIQERFVKGRLDMAEKAAARVKQFGGNEEAFRDALELTGKRSTEAMKTALEEVDEMDRPRVLALVEKIRELDDEFSDKKKDPQQAWAKLNEQRQQDRQAQQEQFEKAKEAVLAKVIKELPEKHPLLNFVDESVEDAETWNGDMKHSHEYARHLTGPTATAEEIAVASIKAGRYDFAEILLLTKMQEWSEKEAGYKAQLAKYESADPSFVGGAKKSTVDKLDRSPGELYRETLEKRKESIV